MALVLVEIITFIMGCDYQEGSWWVQDDPRSTFTITKPEDIAPNMKRIHDETMDHLMDLETSLPWCMEDGDDFGLELNPNIAIEFINDNGTPEDDLVVIEGFIKEAWDSVREEAQVIPF